MKKLFLLLSLPFMAMAMSGCNQEPEVKNIIYMIGDGMGLAQVSVIDDNGFTLVPFIGTDIDAGGEIDLTLIKGCFNLYQGFTMFIDLLTTVIN